jgi:hypothetical protein
LGTNIYFVIILRPHFGFTSCWHVRHFVVVLRSDFLVCSFGSVLKFPGVLFFCFVLGFFGVWVAVDFSPEPLFVLPGTSGEIPCPYRPTFDFYPCAISLSIISSTAPSTSIPDPLPLHRLPPFPPELLLPSTGLPPPRTSCHELSQFKQGKCVARLERRALRPGASDLWRAAVDPGTEAGGRRQPAAFLGRWGRGIMERRPASGSARVWPGQATGEVQLVWRRAAAEGRRRRGGADGRWSAAPCPNFRSRTTPLPRLPSPSSYSHFPNFSHSLLLLLPGVVKAGD